MRTLHLRRMPLCIHSLPFHLWARERESDEGDETNESFKVHLKCFLTFPKQPRICCLALYTYFNCKRDGIQGCYCCHWINVCVDCEYVIYILFPMFIRINESNHCQAIQIHLLSPIRLLAFNLNWRSAYCVRFFCTRVHVASMWQCHHEYIYVDLISVNYIFKQITRNKSITRMAVARSHSLLIVHLVECILMILTQINYGAFLCNEWLMRPIYQLHSVVYQKNIIIFAHETTRSSFITETIWAIHPAEPQKRSYAFIKCISYP